MRAWITPSELTGGTVCRQFVIPVELAPHLQGAVDALLQRYNWEVGGVSIDDTLDALQSIVEPPEECEVSYTPTHHNLSLVDFTKTSGTADIFDIDSAQWKNGTIRSSTPANGDNWRILIPLAAGNYTIAWVGMKTNNAGILRAKIDNVSVGTVDTYQSVKTVNQRLSFGAFALSTDEIATLDILADGKNASSSGYVNRTTEILIYQ